ncbi:MAG: ATPase [Piscirickettsiaceae bacterium CG_4_9_14_3_um_filter_43_564]|nr:cation-translocating P-type ATPase [Thiomicrospira sp.]OIP94595.1 MAG: ATPase [Thiomicrospira sp. CG2_30_44_34]PIQ03578.1 MAG: ATPase [Piscirickettsiaceae bacterium CG18_big_fil_WC_8_21_14_2_50_44_103]PIU38098.1 MAG: ATPase [Piscirickettsiaceae bacterium CG07_land_8_20_14_0_80_44_28]PIW56668.1 MAG: ATPase [Piscirickettsiaceae bacterium CG12_big_fil_rev_8_21_14_0_65_44_934]PIW77283.1 MAG: ATPase [Piscirickettsiaceae bacterium CG_4_8_14_3_um_filter_44_38]PIX79449.1 MAG: ATPase [Pisciricketts
MASQKWFQQSIQDTLDTLGTDIKTGLNPAVRQQKQAEFGSNALIAFARLSPIKLFLRQLTNPLLVILAIGALLSFYTHHFVDAIAISVIILINALISFIQEFKAQKSIDALRDMAAPHCMVKQAGQWQKITTSQLVPGDIIKLSTGDIIPADCRFIETAHLQVNESALTGESDLIEKNNQSLEDPSPALGDQFNMGFMSTSIHHGHGIAIVVATGMETEVGKIATLMQTTENRLTPLQLRIQTLSHTLIWAALIIVAIIIGIGLLKGLTFSALVNTSISLAVAAIPEGLPTLVTIVLTLGAGQMMRNNALAKQLASVETLGSTSVICSDKTGTLTQNKMQVVQCWASGEHYQISGSGYQPLGHFVDKTGAEIDPGSHFHLTQLLSYSVLCSEALLVENAGRYDIQGLPTEGAIVVAAAKAGLSKDALNQPYQPVQTHPFDAHRKMMSVIVQEPNGRYLLIVKGAPDILLKHSEIIAYQDKHLDQLSNSHLIDEVIHQFGSQALRTLAVAYRELSADQVNLPLAELESQLTFLGVHGIIDPPRSEAIQAINDCHSAGIRVVMITGDHAITAKAIAKKMGIIDSDEALVISGDELNQLSDTELEKRVPHVRVFARVTPEHKLRIVQALQQNGEVVAMTGDGVNDAPAVRKADIGIVMGITGTGVAKESADLILLDDNFATIVHAVREGRRIYDNIRKFIRQGLTANVSEVSAILFAFLLISGEPLLTLAPMMILWVNLVSDGIPSLALGVDTAESDVMARQPRPSRESFFAHHLGSRILIRGLVMGGVSYSLFQVAINLGSPIDYAQTIAFATLIFGQLFHVFDARTFSTLYHRNPFSNQLLVVAVIGSALLSLLMIYTPFGNLILGTTPLSFEHLMMVCFISALPTFILSALKELFNWSWL